MKQIERSREYRVATKGRIINRDELLRYCSLRLENEARIIEGTDRLRGLGQKLDIVVRDAYRRW